MNIDDLKLKLCDYGNPQIVKQGYVFTVLITGSGFTKWRTINTIQSIVLECAGKKFPMIEAMRNDENFLCIILKPGTGN